MELEGSINIVYGILHHIFQILDTEDVPLKQIIPCLAILLQKSKNDIGNIIKKTRQFCEKNLKLSKKIPNDLEKLGHVGIFCQNAGIKAYTLENYSNFKSKFSFNNRSICLN